MILNMCVCIYNRANTSWRAKPTKASYPVDDEDLADAELVLELLGGDGDRVEVTETPETHRRRKQEVNNKVEANTESPSQFSVC